MSSEELAAAALRRHGFLEVRSIREDARLRTADLVGELGGIRYAIEVRTATRRLRADASFAQATDGKTLPYPTLEAYLALLWREKRGQLEATMTAEACPRGVLLIIAEGEPGLAWMAALERAWRAAGGPTATRFAVSSAGVLTVFPEL